MEKIIEQFGLKAGAHNVFNKALRDLHIPFYEIENVLPLIIWRDKKELDEATYQIRRELEEKGITITNFTRPKKKPAFFPSESIFLSTFCPINN